MTKKEKIFYWIFQIASLIWLGIKKLLKIALFFIISIIVMLFELVKMNKN